MPAAPHAIPDRTERCAGTTTPDAVWPRYGRKPRTKPCARPVAYVVENGSTRTLTCTAHLGGLTARAASKMQRGPVSVWTLAHWRAEVEA